jgi:AcrR family transcriptional regulator
VRREQTRREIVAAAWDLARERGVAAWTMRDLGSRVGMRAQSLYVYYPSKFAVLDAMFADGCSELDRRYAALAPEANPDDHLRKRSETFLAFACEDLARYQLLFQRVVPGFEPSAESYAIAVRSLARTRAALAACGVQDPRAMDLYTGVIAGLAAQQNANEPGGTRWRRLHADAIDMYLAHVRGGLGNR